MVPSVAVFSSSVPFHCVLGVAALDPTLGDSTTSRLIAVRTVWQFGVVLVVL